MVNIRDIAMNMRAEEAVERKIKTEPISPAVLSISETVEFI